MNGDCDYFSSHLLFSGRFYYRAGGGVPLHPHPDDWQIQVVYDGSAEVSVGSESFSVGPGDVVFVPRGVSHAFFVGEAGLKSVECKFAFQNGEGESLFCDIPSRFEDKNRALYYLVNRLVDEGQGKMMGYHRLCECILVEILISILRISSHSMGGRSESSVVKPINGDIEAVSPAISEMTSYIYKNINRSFSLAEMAAGCGYNQDYLYRLVRREYGISAVQYVNLIRFDQAKRLIEHTELSLSEIAWNLGFESLQYFSRFFRKYAEMSPSEYASKVRLTVRNDF